MLLNSSSLVLKTIIDTGSFTKAAQVLGISGAAVGKHVQQLEDRLNMRLFHRTTRRVTPTDNALRLYAVINQSQTHFQETLETLSNEHSTPSGRLRLNVPMAFAELFLAAPIAAFAARYPQVVVDVDFDDKRVHLIEEGFDLVVRIGALEDSGLIARKIMDFPIVLCASPAFLMTRDTPERPDDIRQWPLICYTNMTHAANWSFTNPQGHLQSMTLPPALYTNSTSMMKHACLQGVGLGLLPLFCCKQELDTGQLVPILPDYPVAPERAVYAVYPDKQFLALKVRLFIDVLIEMLSHKTG